MATLPKMFCVRHGCTARRGWAHHEKGIGFVLDILSDHTHISNRSYHHPPHRSFVSSHKLLDKESAPSGDAAAAAAAAAAGDSNSSRSYQETTRAATATLPPITFDARTINRIRIQTMAILQRGTCCGSQCRACPYGWTNVKTNKPTHDEFSANRRPALVSSGDVQATQTLLRQLQQGDADALQRVLENAHVAAFSRKR